jgi:predicted transposase YdaD
MSKPYDATTKTLLETRPEDWLPLLGQGPAWRVRLIDTDVSTVTAAADKVLYVEDREPWLLHLELQAGRDADLVRRTLRYNVLLDCRHDLPVQSVIVLLRLSADGPELTGVYERPLPRSRRSLLFDYEVLRVWQVPADSISKGGPGTLPLAPIADVAEDDLPDVIRHMERRLSREVPPAEAEQLWIATYVLMGLRYPPALATQLLQGVRAMKESATYQAIIAEGEAKGRAEGRVEGRVEGRAEEARRFLLLLGRKHLGEPDQQAQAQLAAITGVAQLERLGQRLLDVATWQELLRPIRSRGRNGKERRPS